MKKISHIFEYLGLVFAFALFGRLPLKVSALFFKGLALLLYRLVPPLSRPVRANIAMTIGKDWSGAKREDVVRKTFIHGSYFLAEYFKIPYLGNDVHSFIQIEGTRHLDEALKLGKGLILVSGHFGNWELLNYALSKLGYKVQAIYKKLANPLTDRFIYAQRQRLSHGLIEMKSWREKSPTVLAANEILGIVPDQDARHHGIFVDFLGKKASTYVGPALFAHRHDAPLIVGFLYRERIGRYRCVFEPVVLNRSLSNLDERILHFTQQWVRKLEDFISRCPDQYFWFHLRWKTRPDEEKNL